jgi:hypothetical protein
MWGAAVGIQVHEMEFRENLGEIPAVIAFDTLTGVE